MGMAENTRERGREQAGMTREGRRTMEKVLENTVRDNHRYLLSKYILLLLIQWPMNEQVQNLPGLIRHCEGIKM